MKFLAQPEKEPEDKVTSDVVKLLQEFEVAATECTSQGKRIVLVIDGVDKVEENAKTHLPLHWVPASFPKGVHVILSTVSTHKRSFKELVEVRKLSTLSVLPLTVAMRRDMCQVR